MMLMISDDSRSPVGLALKATIEKTGSNLQYFSADVHCPLHCLWQLQQQNLWALRAG